MITLTPADHVLIREVGPRDGFQNEPELISTADKVDLINRLVHSGVPRIELTSFVRQDVIPQLADAADVLHAVDIPAGVSRSVLIPNERGLDHALEHREHFDEIGVVVSASETHNRKNVNRTCEQSLAGIDALAPRAVEAGLGVEAVIATAFGCPYEGEMDRSRVFEFVRRLIDAGAREVAFGDTTGMANPVQVRGFFDAALSAFGDEVLITAHFHNTRGQGLANAVAAWEAGCRSFESSFGELGGCPVPAGATGNIATEDLVGMLHEMGVHTGVDLPLVLDAARAAAAVLGRPLGSHTLIAGPIAWDRRVQG